MQKRFSHDAAHLSMDTTQCITLRAFQTKPDLVYITLYQFSFLFKYNNKILNIHVQTSCGKKWTLCESVFVVICTALMERFLEYIQMRELNKVI